MPTLLRSIVGGQIRTALAVGAGALVTSGALQKADSDKAVEIATGLAIYAISAAWSAANKRWFHLNLGA